LGSEPNRVSVLAQPEKARQTQAPNKIIDESRLFTGIFTLIGLLSFLINQELSGG
jgi:hypothetical protein